MVRINGYQTIKPGTTVTISVSNLRNLGTAQMNTAYAAVMLFYHGLSTQAYLYRPISKIMLYTTGLAAVPFTACSVSYPGNNVVLTPTSFTLTFTPTYTIKTTDYIVVTFPKNTIDPYNPTTGITCSNCVVQMYYKSGVMRIYPNSAIASTSATFQLLNFPTSAYAMYNSSLMIKVDAYLDGKQKNSNSVIVTRTV